MWYIWQRLNNIGLVTGSGGLFATRLATESGGLATNPPCDKPVEDNSTLHRGARQGFVTRGPRQRFVTEGETATNPYFEALPCVHICMYVYIYIYMDICFLYLTFAYQHKHMHWQRERERGEERDRERESDRQREVCSCARCVELVQLAHSYRAGTWSNLDSNIFGAAGMPFLFCKALQAGKWLDGHKESSDARKV